MTEAKQHAAELVRVEDVRPHPRNYRQHPDDQLDHIAASIRAHGFYRNVVVARDGTILAGHGVVAAATRMGLATVPAVRLDLDPDEPRALKVIASDNEISNLAEVDDRKLTEMLREIMAGDGLAGTGFNEEQLAALVLTTRPASEVRDRGEAAHWVGMPGYDNTPALANASMKLTVSFESEEAKADFFARIGVEPCRSTWWPPRTRDDVQAVRFEAGP